MRLLAPTMLALAALLAGCGVDSAADQTPVATINTGLAVYVASEEPTNTCTVRRTGPAGALLFLASTPLITDEDVSQATSSVAADGGPAIVLDITESGAKALGKEAAIYVDRRLAFLWNGQIIYAPVVRSPLSARLMIVGGTDALSADMLQEIAEQINSAALVGESRRHDG